MDIYDAITDYYNEKNICTIGETAKVIGTDAIVLWNLLLKYEIIKEVPGEVIYSVTVKEAFKDLFVVVELRENNITIKYVLLVKRLSFPYLKKLVEAEALLINVDDIPF